MTRARSAFPPPAARWLLGAALAAAALPAAGPAQTGREIRWLKMGSLHHYLLNWGAEIETGRTGLAREQMDGLRWEAQFPNQDVLVAKALWIGCTDFAEPDGRVFPRKVVAVGPRGHDEFYQFVPTGLSLLGRFAHPQVYVDGISATDNDLNDAVDAVDPSLPCDRMAVNTLVTSIGVSVTRRVMQFAQPNHDNYLVSDYVFRNTGVTRPGGPPAPRTLTGVYFHFQYRYGSGLDAFRAGSAWMPSNNINWGRNAVNQTAGIGPRASAFDLRVQYSWYGPHSQAKVDDWGCPNPQDGRLAAVHYMGTVVLHADASPRDPSDDPNQPRTTLHVGSDNKEINYGSDQFNETFMAARYRVMSAGHPDVTHADLVGDQYADQVGDDAGGYSQGQGFGPYTLEPGDSVHLVIAEGVSGMKREKALEVGRNWYLRHAGLSQPELALPGGGRTEDEDVYKKAWVKTGEDSILQTFHRAASNYRAGYRLALPPPPPDLFEVQSGGDKIALTWSANAEGHTGFAGYDVYRAVNRPDTLYEKVFSCGTDDLVNGFDDRTAQRGFDYYYYVASRDDGASNDAFPGTPMASSKFYTLTSEPAFLRKPAVRSTMDSIRVVPNPFHAGASTLQFGGTTPDRIAFFGLPPECVIKIYTERGDLVDTIVHDDGTADELWDSLTEFRQVVVSGVYIALFEATRDVPGPDGGLLIRKGERKIRKFFVLR